MPPLSAIRRRTPDPFFRCLSFLAAAASRRTGKTESGTGRPDSKKSRPPKGSGPDADGMFGSFPYAGITLIRSAKGRRKSGISVPKDTPNERRPFVRRRSFLVKAFERDFPDGCRTNPGETGASPFQKASGYVPRISMARRQRRTRACRCGRLPASAVTAIKFSMAGRTWARKWGFPRFRPRKP